MFEYDLVASHARCLLVSSACMYVSALSFSSIIVVKVEHLVAVLVLVGLNCPDSTKLLSF